MAERLSPPRFAPMLPTLVVNPPGSDEWAFEVKWDGVRALAYLDGASVALISRNGNNISSQYPELLEITEGAVLPAVLDGEIVAFDAAGRPSFEALQGRMGVTNPRQAAHLSGKQPVVMMVFDVLWMDGRNATDLPYRNRRKLLDDMQLPSECWRLSAFHIGDGPSFLAASRAGGLEGLVAKGLDSIYEPGRRTRTWLKIKNHLRQEFVVVGYTMGEGNRESTLGALLIGYNDRPGGQLLYAGKVGTGFTDKSLRDLLGKLRPARVATPLFSGTGMPRHSVYVRPELVAEVEFSEWTKAGMIRHPSFKGLRDDKPVSAIVRELPA